MSLYFCTNTHFCSSFLHNTTNCIFRIQQREESFTRIWKGSFKISVTKILIDGIRDDFQNGTDSLGSCDLTQQNTNIKQCNLNVVEEQKNKQTKSFCLFKSMAFCEWRKTALDWPQREIVQIYGAQTAKCFCLECRYSLHHDLTSCLMMEYIAKKGYLKSVVPNSVKNVFSSHLDLLILHVKTHCPWMMEFLLCCNVILCYACNSEVPNSWFGL